MAFEKTMFLVFVVTVFHVIVVAKQCMTSGATPAEKEVIDAICKQNDEVKKQEEKVKNLIDRIAAEIERTSSCLEAPCTFDFENGIGGWTKTGTVFDNQPTYGDNPTARNRGQPAKQQGNFWIGGYENRPSEEAPAGAIQGDKPQGTLTSPPLKIVGKDISFLIGGGCDMNTVRAELIIDGEIVRTTTGKCTETMSREAWDVGAFIGKTAHVKLIDSSSVRWGHINFDDRKGDIICV